MSAPENPQNPAPEPGKQKTGTPESAKPDAAGTPPEAGKKLTPEEQMALYEEHLKETDWGHQPC